MINFLNTMDLALKPYFNMSVLIETGMDSARSSNEKIASYNPIKYFSAVSGAL